MASKKTWQLQNTEIPNNFGQGTMDVIFDQGGRLATLDGIEKLKMLLVKCVLTGRYVEEDRSYGSTISRLLGQKTSGASEFVESLYLMAVDRALESYRIQQPLDLDASETMASVDSEIAVSRDPDDRTILLIGATVINKNGDLVPVIHSFPIL